MQHICLWSVVSAAVGGTGDKFLWSCPQEISSLVRADLNE